MVLLVLGLSVLTSLLATAQPYFAKLILDQGLIARRFDVVWHLAVAIVMLALLGVILGGQNRSLYLRVSTHILFDMRERVYGHVMSLSSRFFRSKPVGDLVTRLDGDIAEVQRFAIDSALALINSVLLLGAAAVVMLRLSPLLSLVAVGALPLQLLLRHLARAPLRRTTLAVREQSAEIAAFLIETLGGAKAVQAAGTLSYEQGRLRRLSETFLSRLLSQQRVSYAVGSGSSLLSHATTAAIFTLGGYQVIQGSLTPGGLVAFIAYYSRGGGSIISLTNLYLGYQRALVSLMRLAELFESPAEGRNETATLAQVPPAPALQFSDVWYTPWGTNSALLQRLDWSVAGGAKVVLSGASGAGKTSVIDLLCRFVPADSGEITLGGEPIESYSLAALRRSIVVLDTDPALFRGSILHNLRYGHFDVTDEEVMDAARRAGVDDFVGALPEGYQTEVGTGGDGLSAGQRQRIAIARSLLSRPSVLVLDEATSNLDSKAVAELHALIDAHFALVTRIIITHTPTHVPRVDAYYHLHAGNVRGSLPLPERT
jgi:ATP-binding cassette, subfamily B, bacterial